MTKKHLKIVSIMVAILALLFATILIRVVSKKHVLDLSSENKIISENNEASASSITITYPYFKDKQLDGLNKTIQSYIEKLESEYKQQAQENKASEKEIEDYKAQNSLDITYETKRLDQDMVSILFTIGIYTGGAHPNTYVWTINFDTKQKKDVPFTDLVMPGSATLESFSKLVVEKIKADKKDFGYDEEWIKTGAGPSPDNFQKFTIGTQTIDFYFDPYQVASYAEGVEDIKVSKDELNKINHP